MMTNIASSNRITVSGRALQHNYRTITSAVQDDIEVMAMVKGDGYGHDMIFAATAFARAGCRVFGVAELCEGVRLRQAGIAGDIYVMVGFLAEQVDLFFTYELTPVVFSMESIELLSRAARRFGRTIDIHLKVDCGMSRLGVQPHEVPMFAEKISSLPGVVFAGILSHFPEADNIASQSTSRVYAVYAEACRSIEKNFSGIRHIANSGAVLNFPETSCNMVRAGISLYGYAPNGRSEDTKVNGLSLQPAMSFTTRIVQVKEVPAGAGISYGHTYTTSRPTQLAVLPVGYEDGYSRSLSNCAKVLIQGRKVPILGRICMNLCMADVTEIEGVSAGDEAVLLGEQGSESITADDIAGWADTISYEILCMLGNNNERVLIE